MKDKYRIKEAARLFGMSAEALRYYEREHIIQPFRDVDFTVPLTFIPKEL